MLQPLGHSPFHFKAMPEGRRPSAHQAAKPQMQIPHTHTGRANEKGAACNSNALEKICLGQRSLN